MGSSADLDTQTGAYAVCEARAATVHELPSGMHQVRAYYSPDRGQDFRAYSGFAVDTYEEALEKLREMAEERGHDYSVTLYVFEVRDATTVRCKGA
jgi:hypothetical protein